MNRTYNYNNRFPEFDFREKGYLTFEDLSMLRTILLDYYLAGKYAPKSGDSEILAKFKDNSTKVIEEHIMGDYENPNGEITIDAVSRLLNRLSDLGKVTTTVKAVKGRKFLLDKQLPVENYTVKVGDGEEQPLVTNLSYDITGDTEIFYDVRGTSWRLFVDVNTPALTSGQWTLNFTAYETDFTSIDLETDYHNSCTKIIFINPKDRVTVYDDFDESNVVDELSKYGTISIPSEQPAQNDLRDEDFLQFLKRSGTKVE